MFQRGSADAKEGIVKVLFAGNKERGVACLQVVVGAGHAVVGVIAHPQTKESGSPGSVAEVARRMGLPVFQPDNVNDAAVVQTLGALAPDLTVLAGYGQIVKEPFIKLAPLGCLNLHAGRLPEYRGSSPMNWALINGETTFTLSIIAVDAGVDTGDVLMDRTFPIGVDDTIADLQAIANEAFPVILQDVLRQVETRTVQPRKQDESRAGYYPLRFPDDGLILWDQYTAEQVHNRIRALTDPYPGAWTFYEGRRFKLLRSKLAKRRYHGEPGRVYLKNHNGVLVCASDKCLWIEKATEANGTTDALPGIERYKRFATVKALAVRALTGMES
jgi:methionyl-tRNA formyltransferase